MSASLLEMVLAIALSGMILAAAILPTVQTLVAYQAAEADLQSMAAHQTAAVRFEQLAGTIWRGSDPPAGHAALQAAQSGQLQVGNWELRNSPGTPGQVEQRYQGGTWALLARPVSGFTLQYLLDDGTWTLSPTSAQRDTLLAMSCAWNDPEGAAGWASPGVAAAGGRYLWRMVAPDHAFAAALLQLPWPDTAAAYRRQDYQRNIIFTVGGWP